MGNTVLIIDDDQQLCELLAEYLALQGFIVSSIHDGIEALTHLRTHSYDALVLDIMLPGMQGLDVLKALNKFDDTPVLMLTARGEDTDKIVGLEMGADDYLAKPCNPRELSARLRAILRRSDEKPIVDSKQKDNAQIEVGDTILNVATRTATHIGLTLTLTSAEFNMLRVLMLQSGSVVSKDVLSEKALGRPISAYDRSVDVHISKIRKKLVDVGAPNLIVSVRGSGYQFVGEAST